jgi:hypothetical protein
MLKRYERFFGSLAVSWTVYSSDTVYAHTYQLYCFASIVWCCGNWRPKPILLCFVGSWIGLAYVKQAKQWGDYKVLLPVCDINSLMSRGFYMYHSVEHSNILLSAHTVCLYIWYNMIYGMIYDMIRYNMIWCDIWCDMVLYGMIYLTAVGLTPCGSSTVHIYTQTIHIIQRKEHT